MLTIHHLATSQSDRIVWLCEELDVAYTLVRHERDPVTRLAPEAYRGLHPIGTAPIIQDGDLTLGKSGAIIDYIIHRHGGGRLAAAPANPAYPDYLFWFHFANGSFMPAVMMGMVASMSAGADNPVMASLRGRVDKAWAMVEARLGAATYLAGDAFSAADIITVFPLTTMRLFSPRDLSGLSEHRALSTSNRRAACLPARHGESRPGLRGPADLSDQGFAGTGAAAAATFMAAASASEIQRPASMRSVAALNCAR